MAMAGGLYLDTSCLLKLFFPEPETAPTLDLLAREERVVVSELARLEAVVQVQARRAGGVIKAAQCGKLLRRIDEVLDSDPFDVAPCPPGIFAVAEEQARAGRSLHCRTLDRLHLAVMAQLSLRRLLTNDRTQAAAARALRYQVILPAS